MIFLAKICARLFHFSSVHDKKNRKTCQALFLFRYSTWIRPCLSVQWRYHKCYYKMYSSRPSWAKKTSTTLWALQTPFWNYSKENQVYSPPGVFVSKKESQQWVNYLTVQLLSTAFWMSISNQYNLLTIVK